MAYNKLETAISRLRTEAQRLTPDQGRIARRNARSAVRAALRGVKAALNEEFPKLGKPPREVPEHKQKKYVVEWFQLAHREGKRYFNDRWVKFTSITTHGGPHSLGRAMAIAKRDSQRFQATFRVREVGTENVIMADVL